ncbi:unnamed protein product, partial [Laminaria digitata]
TLHRRAAQSALHTCRDCAASLPSQRNRFWCARHSGGERAHTRSSSSSSSCLRSQQTPNNRQYGNYGEHRAFGCGCDVPHGGRFCLRCDSGARAGCRWGTPPLQRP